MKYTKKSMKTNNIAARLGNLPAGRQAGPAFCLGKRVLF